MNKRSKTSRNLPNPTTNQPAAIEEPAPPQPTVKEKRKNNLVFRIAVDRLLPEQLRPWLLPALLACHRSI